jgi:hypothetical protein
VLGWPERISFTSLRRLQLAASENGKLLFLFRPEQAAGTSSPAALRLRLEADRQRGTCINVLKCRGNRPLEPAWIPQPYSVPPSAHVPAPQVPDAVPQTTIGKVQLPASTTVN